MKYQNWSVFCTDFLYFIQKEIPIKNDEENDTIKDYGEDGTINHTEEKIKFLVSISTRVIILWQILFIFIPKLTVSTSLGNNRCFQLIFQVAKAPPHSQMSVCLFVIKTPQQLQIIILHHSSFILQPSSFFIHPSFISWLLSFSACWISIMQTNYWWLRYELFVNQYQITIKNHFIFLK